MHAPTADSGIFTCSSGGRLFPIPGSYGFYEQDAATFASWGVEYVKMDWCNTDINGTQLIPEQVYPNMSRALNATGKPIFFEECAWGTDSPWLWSQPWVNSWRIGGDHHDTFPGPVPPATEGVIELLANKSSYASPGAYNYADMIYTGGQGCAGQLALGAHCPGQTDIEYMTEFTMWAIAASPIIVATNVANLTGIMQQVLLNADMIAVHQDPLAIAGDRRGFTSDPGCPAGYCQLCMCAAVVLRWGVTVMALSSSSPYGSCSLFHLAASCSRHLPRMFCPCVHRDNLCRVQATSER